MFRPNKLLLFLSLSLAFLLAYPSLFAQEESITMTTYYPSPYGSYREMRAKRMAIGDDYIQGETYSWDSLPPSINADADLVVQGNVGIGTTSPLTKLHIFGSDTTYNRAITTIEYSGGKFGSMLAGTAGASIAFDDSGYFGFYKQPNASRGSYDSLTELLRITNTGNVGIGTTSPAVKFHIHEPAGRAYQYITAGGANESVIHLGTDFGGAGVKYGTIYLDTAGKLKLLSGGSLGSPGITVDTNGNVGIGKTDPGYKLDVWGSAWNNIARIYSTSGSSGIEVYDTGVRRGVLYSDSSGFGLLSNAAAWAVRVDYGTTNIYIPGSVGIGVSPVVRLDVGGAVHAAGFPVSSDERFKENIVPLTASGSVLAKMQNIRGIYFDWNELYKNLGRARDSKGRQMGIIAQEIKREFPEVVSIWGDGSGYLAVDYSRFTAVLLEGIKELDQRTKGIKTTVSDKRLKKNITYLQKGLDIIERLKPAKFDYIQGEKRQVGFIAQDIEEVLPDTVTKGQDGMLGSKTESIIPYLVMAIQEQQQEIEGLKLELQRLKDKL